MRKLPVIDISGTTFTVDVDKEALIQQDDKANNIFYANLEYTGEGYRFIYDKWLKNLGTLRSRRENLEEISIPSRVKLDPFGMSQKYRVAMPRLVGKTDFDIVVDQQYLKERLAGKLPTVKINKDLFEFNISKRELTLVANPDIKILLDNLRFNEGREKYLFFYDVISKKTIGASEFGNRDKDTCIYVTMAHEALLDPVGFFGTEISKDNLVAFQPKRSYSCFIMQSEDLNRHLGMILGGQKNDSSFKRKQ